MFGQPTVALTTYYPKPMLWRKERSAFADWIKVVDGQVARTAAHLTPRPLAPDLAAQFLPGWIKIRVRAPFLPPTHRGCAVRGASVAHRGEHAAVKTRSLERHAFGKSGNWMVGAMIRAS